MLTNRENEVLSYCAVGLSAKEIGDKLYRSPDTVRKTISNIKQKTGLQKNTELVAYFFCSRSGIDFYEFKRKIVSSCLLILFMITEIHGGYSQINCMRIRRNRRNSIRIEARCSYAKHANITL
ncbi:MAG TPA: hypothetical protein DDW85_02220 [Porphyromonadaceae bacterium]|nr:hypothetical protein [Porphyromonadaceae bacterium]